MGSKRKRAPQDAGPSPNAKKMQKTSTGKSAESKKKPVAPIEVDTTSPFLDNPSPADHKREVQLYEMLGSEMAEERLVAAGAVITGLLGGDGVEEATLQRHLERRLFRGLASGRKGSRLGFSIVLSEILGQLFGTANLAAEKYAGLTFENVLAILVAKTKPDGDLSGQEEKDHALGLLFGLKGFVQAKILFSDKSRWTTILDKLFDLAKKKPWTREECGWVIVQALEQMNKAQAEVTLEKLFEAGLAITPEGVGIWITAKNQFPKMKFPTKPWGPTGNPLDRMQNLAKALKESSSGDGNEKNPQANQTGSWNPKLHFVWTLVLARYVNAAQSKTPGIKSEFENFWKVTVDENLFSASASRERKFWGFLLFQKVLEEASAYQDLLSSVFSLNLVRCLINSVQDKDRFLNRAADKSLKVLHHAAESSPDLVIIFLPQLLANNGNYNFDKITKTKTVEKLLQLTNDDTATEIVETLLQPVISVDSADSAKEPESRRQMFGDYLLNLIRRVDASSSPTWLKSMAFPKLFDLAYGTELACSPPLSDRTRTLFRNRLSSALTHVLSGLENCHYPCDLLSLSPDAVKMDDDITSAKDQATSTVAKLLKKSKKAKEPKEKAPLQALALLYALVIFQLYNGESEAVSILDELKLCYDKLIRHKDSEESDVEASEVLVELLLSFLSKPSALLRKVTQLVFSAFMSEITADGLKLMTDVLESSESLKGQQELFDQEPEDGDQMEDDNDDEDEDDELDSDVEVVDLKVLNGHLDESDDEDDAEEDEDEEMEDVEDEEGKKLDDALAQALGTHRLDKEGPEEDSDSDADMTDSEMMELDAKLVEIFKQRKKEPNKKQEQKDAKETMVNFKSRVLDLLEIYAKKQATNPLAFGLLIPLLELIRTTKTKQLAEKAQSIIISFSKAAKSAKKSDETPEIDVSAQIKLMKAIHVEASQDPSHLFAKAASNASLLIASSLYRSDKENAKKIAKVYSNTQLEWLGGEIKMQAAFFHDWVNWIQGHASAST
ncbi:hypothetical protein BP6252_02720 [Coleophoma cylindrospora]|uniref:DNA polymerase V n=1 Tax=Coleophoma cylindrospora TaxID=1849047 RepID=A0A3D8SFK1_9HELO|nr:hypothetical protein BP6252_02720 [Coleophoma cylindrospora]